MDLVWFINKLLYVVALLFLQALDTYSEVHDQNQQMSAQNQCGLGRSF